MAQSPADNSASVLAAAPTEHSITASVIVAKWSKSPTAQPVCHVFNCPDLTRIPDGFEVRAIPAQTWLKVEARGALPKSIQSTYPEIEKEWPGGLERIYGMDIEEYGCCETPEDSQKDDYLCRIWIPVKLLGTEHYSVKTDVLTASEFNRLGCAAGWEMPSEKQSAAALRNSLVCILTLQWRNIDRHGSTDR